MYRVYSDYQVALEVPWQLCIHRPLCIIDARLFPCWKHQLISWRLMYIAVLPIMNDKVASVQIAMPMIKRESCVSKRSFECLHACNIRGNTSFLIALWFFWLWCGKGGLLYSVWFLFFVVTLLPPMLSISLHKKHANTTQRTNDCQNSQRPAISNVIYQSRRNEWCTARWNASH